MARGDGEDTAMASTRRRPARGDGEDTAESGLSAAK